MSTAEVAVRRALALDVELLARLGADTFPGNFVGRPAVPNRMVDYIKRNFSPEQQQRELAEPGSVFFIAQRGAEAIGYARLRTSTPPPEVAHLPAGEIHRLYVRTEHWGSGAGRSLVTACVEEAHARGWHSLWLGAWSENARAVGFYRRLGFEDVGTQLFVLGDETHVDLVMTLELTD